MAITFNHLDITPCTAGNTDGVIKITLGLTADALPYTFRVGLAGANPGIEQPGMNNPGIEIYNVPAGNFTLIIIDAQGNMPSEGASVSTLLPNGDKVDPSWAVIDYQKK